MTQPQAAHGKDTVLKIGTQDISAWCNTSSMEKNPDIHDITGYGKSWKVKRGGLIDGTFTIGGWYDLTDGSGPGEVLDDHVGELAQCTRQINGTGPGKPEQTFDVIIGKYVETSPVDDIVTWTCDLAVSDEVVKAAQALAAAASTKAASR